MNANKPFKRLFININKIVFQNFKALLDRDVAAKKVNVNSTTANAM